MTPPGQNVSALAVIHEVFEEMDQPLVSQQLLRDLGSTVLSDSKQNSPGGVPMVPSALWIVAGMDVSRLRLHCDKVRKEVQGDCKEEVACVS